jgi:hypothetical protein
MLLMDKEMKQTLKEILLIVLFAGIGYIVGSNLYVPETVKEGGFNSVSFNYTANKQFLLAIVSAITGGSFVFFFEKEKDNWFLPIVSTILTVIYWLFLVFTSK